MSSGKTNTLEAAPLAMGQAQNLTNNAAGGDASIAPPTSTEKVAALEEQNVTIDKSATRSCHGLAPWIRYRVEYRDVATDKLIDQHETTDPSILKEHGNASEEGKHPVFDVIKTIKTQARGESNRAGLDRAPPLAALVAPLYAIRIYSVSIINALQSIVEYYPAQDLSGDAILIPWPYAILCHHYDQLAEFAETCRGKKITELCVREKNAATHIALLLEYLDETVMGKVREEQERNLRGMITYDWMWVSHRPGQTMLVKTAGQDGRIAHVIHSIMKSSPSNSTEGWRLTFWSLEFDGTFLGRRKSSVSQLAFDGERTFNNILLVNHWGNDGLDEQDDEVKEMVRQGDVYWNAVEKQYQWYQGRTASFPRNSIDALVVVDVEAYLEENPKYVPPLMDRRDCRQWATDCTCRVCEDKEKSSVKARASFFGDYNRITRTPRRKDLTWHQKLLCPREVPGFVFRTRAWERLHVANFSAPRFEANMIDYLVMDTVQLMRLKALALAYARTDKNGQQMTQPAWSADFVQGKGQGLVFLLHGKPGVGKTCTAECIAEFTRSPLMVLTSSDIGTVPAEVERNLTREFKKAKSWGAVLLIDEADVFMERRSTRDLQRNSLVAGFLRALEFYDGILFLTTNRVGSFDDAFISRIHIQLYYKDFNDDDRQKIWQTFVDKLHRERGGSMRLNIDAKEYLKGSELRAVKWNGREIRNAFQTAVSLAEYDAEKDEDGKVLVTDNHLRAVVELSKDFKDYLKELHKADEAKRAASRFERLDDYARD